MGGNLIKKDHYWYSSNRLTKDDITRLPYLGVQCAWSTWVIVVRVRLLLYECFLRLRDNNQLVLHNATVLLTAAACGVDLVYWIL